MRINKAILDHVGAIEREEIVFGHVNVFEGPNGSGKSLRVNALRTALGVEGRTDDFSRLLDADTIRGSTTVICSDVRITRTYMQGGTTLTTKHKATKEKSGAEANRYIKETFDPEVINAEAFLDKDAKKRTRAILEAIPFELDRDGLRAIVETNMSLEGHPLEVVDRIHKDIYDKRTEINRESRAKSESAANLFATTAPEMQLDVLNREIEDAEAALRSMADERDEHLEHKRIAMQTKIDEKQTSNDTLVAGSLSALNIYIERHRTLIADAEAKHRIIENEAAAQLATLKETEQREYDAVRSQCDAEFEYGGSETRRQLIHLRVRRDGEVSAKAVRAIAWENEREGERLHNVAMELSDQLDELNAFKGNMLKELPIPGIELRDGDIWIDGKPSEQAPASRMHILTIDLAIARGAEPIIVDGCDTLDDINFDKVLAHLQRCPRQSFLARWSSDTPFRVRTLDQLS